MAFDVVLKGYDDVEGEEFSGGAEILPAGWAIFEVADCKAGESPAKKTPQYDMDLMAVKGRKSFFSAAGKARHAFTREYIVEALLKRLKGIFSNAIGLPDNGGRFNAEYGKQAVGKRFVGRLEVEESKDYPDKNRLGEWHPVTPYWEAYVERDMASEPEKPERGKKPKDGQAQPKAAGPQIG